MIRLQDVSYRYPGQPELLHRVNMTIAQGQWIGIQGENGSGKSTLLRLMLGLLVPTSGQVLICGKPLRKPGEFLQAAFLSQQARHFNRQFPATVEEVVRSGLKQRHLFWGRAERRRAEEKVRHALELVEMEAFGQFRLGELSGGQQQRVLLARTLAAEPAVLVLDEPAVGLDGPARERFFTHLKRLHHEGMTIVLVDHDSAIHRRMADAIFQVHAGRVELIAKAPVIRRESHV
ncbi:MAG: hypothetical protein BAA01_12625 [Bacillus thermozeamaize]|uniref:ABC transporter domain-containing protein n=1 Tax=Bacillus thermozeamaize TaxID=230954 RepID=A0A1Y3PMS7_9BACI|nr:MAG: hypothetical protein BAA01_12625 [Bacillus thermozeamaize]